MDCIFCKIAKKEIPADCVFENDDIIAFKDLNPQAPVHILVIPKCHIGSLNDLNSDNMKAVSSVFASIPAIAEAAGIKETGYRVTTNCGDDGCQSVKHLHFHLLGGKKLSETLA